MLFSYERFQHPPPDEYDNPKFVKRFFSSTRPLSSASVVDQETFFEQVPPPPPPSTRFNVLLVQILYERRFWGVRLVKCCCYRRSSYRYLFSHYYECNIIIGSLLPVHNKKKAFSTSDIDLCFYGLNQEQFTKKVRQTISFVRKKCGYTLVCAASEGRSNEVYSALVVEKI